MRSAEVRVLWRTPKKFKHLPAVHQKSVPNMPIRPIRKFESVINLWVNDHSARYYEICVVLDDMVFQKFIPVLRRHSNQNNKSPRFSGVGAVLVNKPPPCGSFSGIGRCEDFWTYAGVGSGIFPVLINLMKPVSWCWRPASRSASSISEQVGQIGASRKYKPVSAPHLKHVAMTAPILHRAYGRPRAKSIGQRQALHAKDTPRNKHRGYPEMPSGNQVAGDGGLLRPVVALRQKGQPHPFRFRTSGTVPRFICSSKRRWAFINSCRATANFAAESLMRWTPSGCGKPLGICPATASNSSRAFSLRAVNSIIS